MKAITNEHSKHVLECARRSAGLDIAHLALLANANRTGLYRQVEGAFWALCQILYYCPDAGARFLAEIMNQARVMREHDKP